MIYLDYNATTPIDKQVAEAIEAYYNFRVRTSCRDLSL